MGVNHQKTRWVELKVAKRKYPRREGDLYVKNVPHVVGVRKMWFWEVWKHKLKTSMEQAVGSPPPDGLDTASKQLVIQIGTKEAKQLFGSNNHKIECVIRPTYKEFKGTKGKTV
jgi:hypothetical protein